MTQGTESGNPVNGLRRSRGERQGGRNVGPPVGGLRRLAPARPPQSPSSSGSGSAGGSPRSATPPHRPTNRLQHARCLQHGCDSGWRAAASPAAALLRPVSTPAHQPCPLKPFFPCVRPLAAPPLPVRVVEVRRGPAPAAASAPVACLPTWPFGQPLHGANPSCPPRAASAGGAEPRRRGHFYFALTLYRRPLQWYAASCKLAVRREVPSRKRHRAPLYYVRHHWHLGRIRKPPWRTAT